MISSDRRENIGRQDADAVDAGQVLEGIAALLDERVETVQRVEFHALDELRVLAQLHLDDEEVAVDVGASQVVDATAAVFGESTQFVGQKRDLLNGRLRPNKGLQGPP